MERSVTLELLDTLPPADTGAVRSRRDLRRINAWMGHGGWMATTLRAACPGAAARRMVDLGGGDGHFLLGVARRLSTGWQGSSAVLLDRLPVASAGTRRGFEASGWRLEVVQADVLDWLEQAAAPACDVMMANLFLHHFHPTDLTALLRGAARHAQIFVAAEPRRSPRSLLFSRLLWLIGCNHVTRHDAPVSVRAGFADAELSRLWPADGAWALQERSVGWFSHFFVAQRRA